MTTNVYWSEIEHSVDPTNVYWVEIENTSDIGEAVTGVATLPEITTLTLVGSGSILVGGTVDLTLTVEDQDGDPIPNVTPSVSSSDTGVATVALLDSTDADGEATVRVTGVAIGSVTISASLDGVSTQVSTVPVSFPPTDPPPPIDVLEVTTVTLSVPTIGLEVGTVGAATVTVRDQNGDPLSGIAVTWASTDDAVIADPSGTTTGSAGTSTVALTALAAGTTTITATAGGITSTGVVITVITVAPQPTYSASGSASILVTAESRLAGWERPRVRRFNDADQKKAHPTDRFFEGMVEGVEIEVIWPNREVLRMFG